MPERPERCPIRPEGGFMAASAPAPRVREPSGAGQADRDAPSLWDRLRAAPPWRSRSSRASASLLHVPGTDTTREIFLDLEARIHAWPDGLLGFRGVDLAHQELVRVVHAEDHTAFLAGFRSLRQHGSAYSCTLRCIRKSWETSHLRFTVWPLAERHAEVVGARIVTEDVTELEQLRQEVRRLGRDRDREIQQRHAALLRQLHELRSVLDHLPGSFLLIDREHRVRQISRPLVDELDLPDPEPGGAWRCEDWLRSTGRCLEACPVERVFHEHRALTVTRRVSTPEGTRYIEHRFLPIDADGRVELILEQRTDVTQSRAAEAELLRSERLTAAGEISAIVAHEVRNSLTSIKLTLQLLLESAPKEDDDATQLAASLAAVERIEALVNQLLTYASPIPISPTLTALNPIVEAAVQLVRPQLQRNDVDLQLHLARELPVVQVDREYLQQVLVNLLINAIQAMGTRGQVVIRTRLARLPAARGGDLLQHEGRLGVQVSVEDSGAGVPPEILDKVFDPFFTTKAHGTGLGLPLVRRIVEAHGGLVRLCNAPTQGTIVNLWLPLGSE